MIISQYSLAAAGVVAVYVAYVVYRIRSRRYLCNIPGPPSPSWLFGNTLQLLTTPIYGEYEFKWLRQYGSVYRVKGCFGEDRLIISDPASLQLILNGRQYYTLGGISENAVRLIYDPGSVLLCKEEEHKRLRAALNNGFTAAAVRTYLPIFARVAHMLTEQFDAMAEPSSADLLPSLARATLSAVTQAVLGLSLDDLDDEFVSTNFLMVGMAATSSPSAILSDAIMAFMPNAIRELARHLPIEPLKSLDKAQFLSHKIGKSVIRDIRHAKSQGLDGVGAFYDELVDGTLSEQEVLEQTSILLLAGQDTTANTIGFGLLELAQNIDFQDQLRAEIHSSLGTGGGAAVYENMPLLNAFIKETLRMYPAVSVSDRVAVQDHILPLSRPIMTSHGKQITEIPIMKGQVVYLATGQYQRSNLRWGEDAHEFKPSRWMADEAVHKEDSVGGYANLMTFHGGSRICLGWRFALLEIQVFVSELVGKFKFSLPADDQSRTVCRYALTLQPTLPNGEKGALVSLKRVV
ncbi:cytochrome P450 [Favolaschia claudopus]|uniref:Cytochrome P450 n=1 Tax=Favolaschia claudopus TaxID=2862362 RepID=A0AAW0AGY2_9AGAR